ncbi:MAG: hypothetical protein K1X83_15650 [Oligoflexia bacterium]|nr:hypothetical protein [Oligoflexia bacterium]
MTRSDILLQIISVNAAGLEGQGAAIAEELNARIARGALPPSEAKVFLARFAVFLMQSGAGRSQMKRGSAIMVMASFGLSAEDFQRAVRLASAVFANVEDRWTFYYGVLAREIARTLGVWSKPLLPQFSPTVVRLLGLDGSGTGSTASAGEIARAQSEVRAALSVQKEDPVLIAELRKLAPTPKSPSAKLHPLYPSAVDEGNAPARA